ncbi:MAG: hypothetical protein QOJ07_1499, partial [Thermoleophilaceae bacterium]|nr:hypothetical protein [Thermoleophilaceae bacterium]
VRAVWSERFQHVMVDEYQDTNELQDELIDLLAAGRLFAVGDDRQSIYGFRYADVAGFRERRRQAEAEDRAARLTVNFRSAPAVLEAVNVAFERVWGEGEYEPLAPGAEDESGAEGEPSVELLIVDHSKQHWEAAGLGDDAFGASLHRATIWRAAEARLLAARIDELVRGGDRFGWGDVAILMRAATDMQLYERALAERGIRTYAAGARGYFSQQQIGDLRAYLAALANPLDGVALYGLLASPLVGASLDALTLLRLHARAAGLDPWWALERAFGSGEGSADGAAAFVAALPAADRERLAAFVPRFAAERASAPRLSLETVIDRAQTASGYDRVVLAMPSGERRMANVRKLMRLAREFEGRSGRDLRRFIDYVDEQELIAAREGEAPLETESLDAVRLMTIHAAKGLEFPVVCVADMGRAGNDPATPLRVSNDGRLGLQIASMGGPGVSALDMDDLKAEEEARAEAEERRVFYVAMTRAERHLILSGATDVDKWPEAKPLGRPLDWAWRALVPELPQALGGDAEVTLTAALGERSAPVRCVVCSPETVDRVLPAADRAPAPGAGAGSGSADAADAGEPAFAPVQAPVSLPLARLSYSALEQYARCGYRFYLERVARLRDPELTAVPSEPAVGDLVPVAGDDEVGGAPRTDPWAVAAGDAATAGGQLGLPLAAAVEPDEPVAPGRLDARLRGTVAHELLERIDFDLPRGFSDEEIEARIAAHGSTVDPADVADQRAMVERFLGSEVCGRVRAALRVRKEVPFAFPLGTAGESILVNGVLDVHADEERGALVVDYKSDRLEGADPAAFCDEHYGTQRVVYALAALRAGAERVEVVHLFLERPADPVSVSFAATDAERLEDDLRALAGGVIEGRFEPTGDPHRDLCRGGPGRPALCSWDESRTLAPRGEFHPVAP